MAEALYRKYRPQVFEDVVGQEPIERTLKNAIRQDKVSHAYLFCGPRGTGKTTTARLLAKALLCERGPTPDPDGACEDCLLIADGVHPDVYELDAASRTGVENVREEIISRVHFAPTRGRYKVYIIDEVHMLSTAAFNALLKTLEEPPSHVVFVLCTTDPQKVPETIHSRCQRFDFHRISPESMVARLGAICMAEEVEFEGEALDLIAQRADGGLRNALTSLEQIIAFENGKVTLAGAERLLGSIDSNDMAEILAYIGKRDIANCFRWTAAYVETGADLAQFARDMGEHVRNLYVMALVGDDAALDVSETARRELAHELSWFGPDRAARLLGVLGDLMAELKTTSNQRLAFEIALTRMVRPDSDLTLESLAERVEALESGYSAVAHVLPGNPAGAAGPAAAQGGFAAARAEQPHAAAAPSRADSASRGTAGDAFAAGGDVPAGADSRRAGENATSPSATASAAGIGSVASAEAPAPASVGASAHAPDAAVGAGAPAPASDGAAAGVSTAAGAVAPAVASRASGLANPAALQRIWQAALSDVKKRKQAYGVLFMGSKASFDEASGLVRVAFPAESSFAFNAVQKPDVQRVLEEALAKAAGGEVRFCFEKEGEPAAPPVQAAVKEAAPPFEAPCEQRSQAQAPREQRHQVQAPHVQASYNQVSREQDHREQRSQAQTRREQAPCGQDSREQAPYEQASHGQVPREQAPLEQASYAQDPYDRVPYEDMPYEQVPYEDMPYEQVPYDDFDAAYPMDRPSPQPAAPKDPLPAADAGTAPSPAYPAQTPEGIAQDDPAAIQAMLQASFGGEIVFTEEE